MPPVAEPSDDDTESEGEERKDSFPIGSFVAFIDRNTVRTGVQQISLGKVSPPLTDQDISC